MNKINILITGVFFSFVLASNAYAVDIYVDNSLGANITNNSYSIVQRNSSGADGNAYTTVQAAINAMSPGDHIVMRGGTYQEGHIDIPLSKNGTSWNDGEYNKLSSYPGEWAVLDAQYTAPDGEPSYGAVLGHAVYDDSYAFDLKYWWFERFELTGGGNSVGGAGFFGGGGPFKFRYLYVHDNYSPSGGQNPAGIKGHHIHDSVIEFCYFDNNGMQTGTDTNAANIAIYSDYNWNDTAQNGYDDNDSSHRPGARNIIRYNYIINASVGFKYKGMQLFSGRNPGGGHGPDDTYGTYGDEIHHNIFDNIRAYAIGAHQDFIQIFNNIILNSNRSIMFQYEPLCDIYKGVSYNNTIINSNSGAIMRYASEYFSFTSHNYYGYDYNNLIDNCLQDAHYWESAALDIAIHTTTEDNWDLSNYTGSNNYVYRPIDTQNVQLNRVLSTQSSYKAQNYTSSPKTLYRNVYDSGNLLFEGTSGIDQLITKGTHIVESEITISNGGIGIPHPYLAGVTIPSYISATNPNDNAWVAGVLSLANVTNLMNGSTNDPEWIEGGGGVPPVSLQTPRGFERVAQ